jgi:hypothetical protein
VVDREDQVLVLEDRSRRDVDPIDDADLVVGAVQLRRQQRAQLGGVGQLDERLTTFGQGLAERRPDDLGVVGDGLKEGAKVDEDGRRPVEPKHEAARVLEAANRGQ